MKPWKLILYSLFVTLAIGGIYLYSVFKHRQDPGPVARQAEQAVNPDDLAEVRTLMPTEFKDVAKLAGASVWMKNGYVMPYFAVTGTRIDFSVRTGVLPSAQRMDVKKVIKAAVPDALDDGMSHGKRQAFVIFALPGSDQSGSDRLYATPIGVLDGAQEAYFTDLLFFYDDPHKIYDTWPKDTWAAIDAHQAKSGMNELQVRLALGQKLKVESGSEGNRTITYDQGGKPWTVTFKNNRATSIR
jgi:hypothetical protein